MRFRFRDVLKIILVLFIIAAVLWFILSRLRFVVLIPVSLGELLFFGIAGIIAIVLVVDHFLDIL